jgi:ABC-type transporter Mla MlaB component
MSSQPKPVSYLRAWLTSQTNVMTLLGGGLAMAVASVPAGAAGALGALVVLGAVQTLLALVIPDLPTFRSKVDRGARRGAIDQRRAQLQQELFALHGGIERVAGMGMWQKYQAIVERSNVLYRIAGEAQSQLSYDDAERVDKASVDYLALWLAQVTIKERLRSGEEATLDRRLREAEQALSQIDKLAARRMSIDAALVSLPDQVEEVYQLVVASPYSSTLGSKLGESLSRLQLEEDIELELSQNDLDSDYFKTGVAGAQARSARQAARAAK